MFFSKLKPLPRFILIASVVGGLAFAAQHFNVLGSLPKTSEVKTTVPVTSVSGEQESPQAVAPVQASQPMQSNQQPAAQTQLSNVTDNSAGLSAVLKAGNK